MGRLINASALGSDVPQSGPLSWKDIAPPASLHGRHGCGRRPCGGRGQRGCFELPVLLETLGEAKAKNGKEEIQTLRRPARLKQRAQGGLLAFPARGDRLYHDLGAGAGRRSATGSGSTARSCSRGSSFRSAHDGDRSALPHSART